MKKFKFKLEALLKMRKLKEDHCKMEIGRLQVKKKSHLKEIDKQNTGISKAYQDQEATINKGATGLDLKFYPYFVQGKRSNISLLEAKIKALDEAIEEKYKELSQLRADVKVLDKMKDKHENDYNKAINKKRDQVIEEQIQNWSQFKDRQ